MLLYKPVRHDQIVYEWKWSVPEHGILWNASPG